VTGGLTWTIGQAGLDATDKNLCELATKVWQAPIGDCHILPALVVFWKIAFFAALVFLVVDGYHWLLKRKKSSKRKSIDQDNEIDLTAALFWIMERSAWGRLIKAQYVGWPWETEKSRLREASNAISKASLNGGLAVRGRLKNSLEYLAIDRDFWRSASLEAEPNNAALWKAAALVPGNIAIPDYDNFIVERAAVEALWPRYQWRYYWPTVVLKVKAALKRKPTPMPEPDNKQELVQVQVFDASSIVEATPVVKQEEPEPAAETTPITPTAAAPKYWERLFAVGDDGRSIWLHFMPDTKQDRADALLLIVYGQKVLCGVSRIRIPSAHAAVDKTVSNAPNRFRTSNTIMASLAALSQLQQTVNRDWVDECVPIYLERVGLSQGGFYQLTEEGERRAATLAYDLIRRA
jgi:hypothetical protein